ncbi:TPA: hypothetical protein HA265_07310 [Candidatus Woesearchaeota archaeon]|nr:hypothetical protein [Candidatus Woesearchaeota archaeon]
MLTRNEPLQERGFYDLEVNVHDTLQTAHFEGSLFSYTAVIGDGFMIGAVAHTGFEKDPGIATDWTKLDNGETSEMYMCLYKGGQGLVERWRLHRFGRRTIERAVETGMRVHDIIPAGPLLIAGGGREDGVRLLDIETGEEKVIVPPNRDQRLRRFVIEDGVYLTTVRKDHLHTEHCNFFGDTDMYRIIETSRERIDDRLEAAGLDPQKVIDAAQKYQRHSQPDIIESSGLKPCLRHL